MISENPGDGVGGDKKHNMGFSVTSWTYNSVKYCLWAINETHIAPVALMLHTAGAGHGIPCPLVLYCSLRPCSFLFLKITSGVPMASATFLLGRTGLEIQTMLDSLSHAWHCQQHRLNNSGPWAPACSPQFGLMSIPSAPKPLKSAQENSSPTD